MKKTRSYLVTGSIISVLLLVKFVFFPLQKSEAAVAGKSRKKAVTPVGVFVIGQATLNDKVYASGTIVANEAAELKAETSGRIIYLNIPEGRRVEAGTLLLKVNAADLHAQLDKTTIQLKLASEAEARQHSLLKVGGISQQEYDIVLANKNALRADSAYYQAQIAKTEVRAPFTGVVGIRNVSLGSYITSSFTVAQLQQIDQVKIDFSLPEKYSSLLKVGDAISFRTEGVASVFSGKVIVKDPQVDLNSRSIHYRALSGNPQGALSPGAFARVEIILKDQSNSHFIPTEAVVPVLKGKKVFIVKNGLAEERMIETGLRTEDNIQIVAGLLQGDSVVINGNFQLKNNAPVEVSLANKK